MIFLGFVFIALIWCAKSIDLVGTYQKNSEGIEYVFQIPEKTPRGVIFLAHGCHHSATDWWPKGPSCEKCIGLPVERAIVTKALERNILPVTISSANRKHKCWIPHDREEVAIVLKYIYDDVLSNTDGKNPPLYLLGASSGGSFVGVFGQFSESLGFTVAGACSQISALYSQRVTIDTPPLLFVHMSRDQSTAESVHETIEHLKSLKVSSTELISNPKPLFGDYFFSHARTLSPGDSEKFVAELKKSGFLSDQNFLLADPRQSNWREV